MFPSHFLTTLILVAASWKAADLYHQASVESQTTRVMPAETTPKRPPIDLAAATDFQTATFALG